MYLSSYACLLFLFFSFFFNDTATTEIYTLSLHDALPIFRITSADPTVSPHIALAFLDTERDREALLKGDRKSTRLNSSHANLVCRLLLEKKKKNNIK